MIYMFLFICLFMYLYTWCIYHVYPQIHRRTLRPGGLWSGFAAAATGGAEKGDHEELGRRAAADRRTEKVDVELIGK